MKVKMRIETVFLIVICNKVIVSFNDMKKILLLLFFVGFSCAMEHDEKKECLICRELIKENETVLTCKDLCVDGIEKHVFHKKCIELFLMYGTGVYACPECNRPLTAEAKKQYPRAPRSVCSLMIGMHQVNADLEQLRTQVQEMQISEGQRHESDDLSDEGVGFPSCSIL